MQHVCWQGEVIIRPKLKRKIHCSATFQPKLQVKRSKISLHFLFFAISEAFSMISCGTLRQWVLFTTKVWQNQSYDHSWTTFITGSVHISGFTPCWSKLACLRLLYVVCVESFSASTFLIITLVIVSWCRARTFLCRICLSSSQNKNLHCL